MKINLRMVGESLQRLLNSKGDIYYGMHFYPGVAEYSEAGKDPFRIFVNEDTIRKMNPTFAGRPVFVEHVDEVGESVDELRKEADGWVVESFFNEADGKHWVKFIIVSERARSAIKKGYRLSNAYIPQGPFGPGGLWNGVTYAKQVLGGEYEHLAIVKNPRYEESVIMTPDEFKNYCEEQKLELKRLANSNEKENTQMKLNFFKKKVEKVENSADLQELSVTLPKSGKDVTVIKLVEEADARAVLNGYANEDDKVKVGENEMSVKDMVANYGKMCSELEELKKAKNEDGDADEEADESMDNEEGEELAEADAADAEPEEVENEDEKAAEKDAKDAEPVEGKKSNSKAAKPAPKGDKKHFDKLKNAHRSPVESARVDLMDDQLARGKARYGSH